MKFSREKVRELVFKALFALENNKQQNFNLLNILLFKKRKPDDYYQQLVKGILPIYHDLEKQYSNFLKSNWSLSRISKTSSIALQIGLYEIKQRIDIPNKVAIDQATNLAKKFGGPKEGAFVNGILARFM